MNSKFGNRRLFLNSIIIKHIISIPAAPPRTISPLIWAIIRFLSLSFERYFCLNGDGSRITIKRIIIQIHRPIVSDT